MKDLVLLGARYSSKAYEVPIKKLKALLAAVSPHDNVGYLDSFS